MDRSRFLPRLVTRLVTRFLARLVVSVRKTPPIEGVADFLPQEAILPDLRADSLKAVLRDMAATAESLCGVDRREILAALVDRERLGGTGHGEGVAMPRARLSALRRPLGIFARLREPLEARLFAAPDDRPIDLVFALLAPDEDAAPIKLLARASRAMRRPRALKAMRNAQDAEALRKLLTDESEDEDAP